MDRRIVYAGELPRLEDFMGFEKAALYALGYLADAVLGESVAIQGLACNPTSPASMQVNVSPGSIYSAQTADSTAFGALGADSNTIVKQGLLLGPATLTITAPGTAGYSQVYLVQAAYNDVDSGALVLPYYNAANPAQPFSGPNNSETSQYTVRGGVCAISLKAGVAATTGTQTAPAVDAGYVGLYLITVANGATSITSGNITVYPGAPFIPFTLPQAPAAIQAQAGNYALDTGTANAIAIQLPVGTVLTDGMPLRIKKKNAANTSAVTVSVNSGSPFPAVFSDGSPLIGGDWGANDIGDGVYIGGTLYLSSPAGPSVFRNRMGSARWRVSGSWTVPAGVSTVKRVRVWGAGGGGGGASGTSQSSAGGGGGGFAEAYDVPVTPGSTITVTVGAGGAGGVGANAGSNGGTTTFGSSTAISGSGGTGGSYNNSPVTQGTGGSGTNGDINITGRDGSFPFVWSSQTAGGIGGGAPFSMGNGHLQITTTGGLPGNNGGFPGCGGNGACTGSSGGSQTGGQGADGLVIIEW